MDQGHKGDKGHKGLNVLGALVLDFTITATYFVMAIGAPFQKYDDILGQREHKDTEKNTLQVARSTRRRAAAGEACLTARPAVQADRVERLCVS